MARSGLTDRMVKQAREPGVLIDGKGLRLRVTANAQTGAVRKSWVLRVTVKGAGVRELGLGSASDLSLADARERATQARKLARDGIDPLLTRNVERAERAREANRAMTFKQCAEAYIEAHKASWRNAKHADQWTNTLTTYAYPVLGAQPVQAIDVALVMKVLDPIWQTKTETASRVRQRIESVLDWATVRDFRRGENPARWRGHLQKVLPARAKVQKVRHHPALPYADLPAFMADLRAREGMSANALEFLILTGARTNEVLQCRWSEIDLDAKIWTVPAERMKARREHRVPLSPAALRLLKALASPSSPSAFVFAKDERALSSMALLALLQERMGRDDLTAHGFRSTFKDWASEQTNFAREVAEAALAHVVGDKVEAAYRRGDLFEKRRKLMDAWSTYCGSKPRNAANVIPMRKS